MPPYCIYIWSMKIRKCLNNKKRTWYIKVSKTRKWQSNGKSVSGHAFGARSDRLLSNFPVLVFVWCLLLQCHSNTGTCTLAHVHMRVCVYTHTASRHTLHTCIEINIFHRTIVNNSKTENCGIEAQMVNILFTAVCFHIFWPAQNDSTSSAAYIDLNRSTHPHIQQVRFNVTHFYIDWSSNEWTAQCIFYFFTSLWEKCLFHFSSGGPVTSSAN